MARKHGPNLFHSPSNLHMTMKYFKQRIILCNVTVVYIAKYKNEVGRNKQTSANSNSGTFILMFKASRKILFTVYG